MNEFDLRLLVERFHTGDLTPAEEKTLEKALEDPAARRLFVQDMTLLAALRSVLKVENSNSEMAAEISAKPTLRLVKEPAHRAGKAGVKRRKSAAVPRGNRGRRGGPTAWLAVAALFLVIAGLAALYWTVGAGTTGNQVIAGVIYVNGQKTKQVADGALAENREGTPAQLRLVDGSTLELDPASAAVLEKRLIHLQSGKGTFQVAATGGEFKVVTGVGSVTVLGTDFSVNLHSKPTKPEIISKPGASFTMTVKVTTGKVGVDCEGVRTVLQAGQIQIFGAGPVLPPALVQVPVPTPEEPPTEFVLPPELIGFEGMVTGKVVRVSADSIVIELMTATKKGDTRNLVKGGLKGKEVQVNITEVKNPPAFKLDDSTYCTCKELDGYLVASSLIKAKGSGQDVHNDDTF